MLLVGCGGGGDGSTGTSTGSGVTLNQGKFIDSPVACISYVSVSQSGITDEQGTFIFEEGAKIRFYIERLCMVGQRV